MKHLNLKLKSNGRAALSLKGKEVLVHRDVEKADKRNVKNTKESRKRTITLSVL